jgi:hypothetical protein
LATGRSEGIKEEEREEEMRRKEEKEEVKKWRSQAHLCENLETLTWQVGKYKVINPEHLWYHNQIVATSIYEIHRSSKFSTKSKCNRLT